MPIDENFPSVAADHDTTSSLAFQSTAVETVAAGAKKSKRKKGSPKRIKTAPAKPQYEEVDHHYLTQAEEIALGKTMARAMKKIFVLICSHAESLEALHKFYDDIKTGKFTIHNKIDSRRAEWDFEDDNDDRAAIKEKLLLQSCTLIADRSAALIATHGRYRASAKQGRASKKIKRRFGKDCMALVEVVTLDRPGKRYFEAIYGQLPEAALAAAETIRVVFDEARNVFVEKNQHFVALKAGFYLDQGLPFQDLCQEGTLGGLMRAAEKWTPERGLRFLTYAGYWVNQALARAVAEQGRTVSIPVNLTQTWRSAHSKITKATSENGDLDSKGNQDPDLQKARETVDRLRVHFQPALYLDAPAKQDSETPRANFVSGDPEREPEAVSPSLDIWEHVQARLLPLSCRQQFILWKYYGLRDDRNVTSKEIGTHFKKNVSGSRIRQERDMALLEIWNSYKLRNPSL